MRKRTPLYTRHKNENIIALEKMSEFYSDYECVVSAINRAIDAIKKAKGA